MRTHVIVNVRAAKFLDNASLLGEMRAVCHEAALHLTASEDALDGVCEQAARAGAELVVLCGGDGSAMAGVTSLNRAFAGRAMPIICLAPGGHSCTIARNWGRLLRCPARHVTQVLAQAESGCLHVRTRPSLRVVQNDGSERIGFIFGTGLVSSFFQAFYERGGGGYGAASQMIARIFLGSFVGGRLARRVLSPMPCTLTIDGSEHPNSAFTLIVSAVVKDLGLHLRVAHRAAEDPQRPHLVASSLGLIDCGRQYGRVLAGRPLIDGRTVDRLANGFSVRFSRSDGAYVLDGDLFRTEEVRVQAGPELRIASLGP